MKNLIHSILASIIVFTIFYPHSTFAKESNIVIDFIGVVEKDFQLGKHIGAIIESKYPKANIAHTGPHKGTVIIGRDMNMVRDAHKSLGEANVETRIFDGDAEVGSEARKLWEDMKKTYADAGFPRVPDTDIVVNAKIYNVNETWLKDRLSEGYNVLDIGSYTEKNSVFYEMEKRVIKEFQNGSLKP